MSDQDHTNKTYDIQNIKQQFEERFAGQVIQTQSKSKDKTIGQSLYESMTQRQPIPNEPVLAQMFEMARDHGVNLYVYTPDGPGRPTTGARRLNAYVRVNFDGEWVVDNSFTFG